MAEFAYVFAGRNGLDNAQARIHVLRIPEVSCRIREAQAILDSLELPSLDLLSYIASDDESFLRNIQLKSLAAAIVQVGLFDRIQKSQRLPEILVGNVNGDSALMTVLGRQSFADMVRLSPALETLKPAERLSLVTAASPAPLLAGVSLAEYEAVASGQEARYETLQSGQMDLAQLLASLVEKNDVRGFVNIGPAGFVTRESWGFGEVDVLDSIELDPMLSWFWSVVRSENRPENKPANKAIAN